MPSSIVGPRVLVQELNEENGRLHAELENARAEIDRLRRLLDWWERNAPDNSDVNQQITQKEG